jgi:hypothetical protein
MKLARGNNSRVLYRPMKEITSPPPQMDKKHNTKGLRWTPSPLFKISTNGMGPEDKNGLATISRHV